MATSFPFLKIARDHGVPYDSVLRIADALPLLADTPLGAIKQMTEIDLEFYRRPLLINEIVSAIVEERNRREMAS
jgi:hypothetical protein